MMDEKASMNYENIFWAWHGKMGTFQYYTNCLYSIEIYCLILLTNDVDFTPRSHLRKFPN